MHALILNDYEFNDYDSSRPYNTNDRDNPYSLGLVRPRQFGNFSSLAYFEQTIQVGYFEQTIQVGYPGILKVLTHT